MDKSWAEFPTLEAAACLLSSAAIRPNLVLKTLPKQLLRSLPLETGLLGFIELPPPRPAPGPGDNVEVF